MGENNKNFRVFGLLALALLLVYSNTFRSPWHFDDHSNIRQNPGVHLEKLDSQSILGALKYQDAFSSRPLAHLSFAVNWYFGKDNVTGYHIVNLIIHLLASFFLYLTFRNLFKTPVLIGKYKEISHRTAILAAFLWAIHPIQIQAVTYIVQRMAAMAAMFYFFGLFSYVKGRLCPPGKKR